MKKIIAVFLCLAMVLSCTAGLAEQTREKTNIGTISVNGAFVLKCAVPEGYSVQPVYQDDDQVIAMVASENEDDGRPQMILSVAFDETYADVDRMNDLDEEQLAILEQTYTDQDSTVELSYGETGLGTRLLIARQSGQEEMNYVDFLSVYKGYFVEFVVVPTTEDGILTDEQFAMCVDFLTELDFVPATAVDAVNTSGQSYTAVIRGYDEENGVLKITLRVPFVLTKAEVEALQEGETIDLGAGPEEIYSVKEEDGYIILNDEIELRPQEGDTYCAFLYEKEYMLDAAELETAIPEGLVFIDEIDSESLEVLEEPKTLTGAELVAEIKAEAENGPGFDADNVTVTFDEFGELAEVRRFYVPWQ